jgi:hypothetical protein
LQEDQKRKDLGKEGLKQEVKDCLVRKNRADEMIRKIN